MALGFFLVTGKLTAVTVDYVDASDDPDVRNVSATITFTPRIPRGELLWASGLTPPQGIMLPPITARFDADGILRTIVGGVGVKLTANTADIDRDELIYDVAFANVNVPKTVDYDLISPFAFAAPTTAGGTVDLANVDRLPPKVA